jgi:hypothetical protein
MAHVSVRQEVGAPAEAVWHLLGHPESASSWPGVERCEIEGSGAGCVRTLQLVGDERLSERFDELDEASRRFHSEVLELGRLPLRAFRYSMTVSEIGPDRCAIDWDVDFEPDGIDEARARELVKGFYTSMAVSVRQRLRCP